MFDPHPDHGGHAQPRREADAARRVRVTAPDHAALPDLGTPIRAALSGERRDSEEHIGRLIRSRLRLALTCAATLAAVLALALLNILAGAAPRGAPDAYALLRWGVTGAAVLVAVFGIAVWFHARSSRLEQTWHEEREARGADDAR